MTTIIDKNPDQMLAVYLANKPKNGVTKLFLIKNGIDIPFYGLHIIGKNIYVIKSDQSEVFVDASDIVELRT